jgi:hypothetical protein
MAVHRTDAAKWSLAMHSEDSNMCSLVNLGTKPAVDVTVQLMEGAHQRRCGTVQFGRIDPGSAVIVYRYNPDLDVPPWDRVTVTWREVAGGFPRKRLHHWDSDSESASSSSQ